MSPGPLALYRERRNAGLLNADPCQALAAEKLESLARALAGYRPQSTNGESWLARFGLKPAAASPPQGLYLYGAVGRDAPYYVGAAIMVAVVLMTVSVPRGERTR